MPRPLSQTKKPVRIRRSKPGDPRVALAYLRVSTKEQKLGPQAQRYAIEQWAKKEGIHVAEWFEDMGVSGGTPIDERPGLMNAVASLRTHSAGILVVAKRDRLARDVFAAASIHRLAATSGARVWSVAGEGTDDDPTGKLMLTMIDAFAEYERAMIKARISAALQVKIRQGLRVGKVRYGYQLGPDGKSLIPHEGEREIMAIMAGEFERGASEYRVEQLLRERGITSRSGKTFSRGTIRRFFLAWIEQRKGASHAA